MSTRRLGEVVRGEPEDGDAPKLPGFFPAESINPSISVVVPFGRLFMKAYADCPKGPITPQSSPIDFGEFLGRFVRFLCSKTRDTFVVAPLQNVFAAARIRSYLPV
jgi:hypothetical protein